MNRTRESPGTGLALFDLDGTLTRRQTLGPFLAGYLLRHPRRWPRLWRALPALVAYVLRGGDRGALKSRLIRMAMGGEERAALRAWTEAYVRSLAVRGAYRPAALERLARHRDAGDTPILMSASPDLYVPAIGAALGFAETICTRVRWRGDTLDGALASRNRRGEEKRRCLEALRRAHPGRKICAYGNSAADLPHLRAADRGVLVNGTRGARRAARKDGVEVERWH